MAPLNRLEDYAQKMGYLLDTIHIGIVPFALMHGQ